MGEQIRPAPLPPSRGVTERLAALDITSDPSCCFTSSLLLHPDRPTRLDGARHAELRVESGIVWITAGGAAGDLFLAAGQSYRPPRRSRVLVEALRGQASVRLLAPRPALPSLLARWWRAVWPATLAR